MRAAGQTIYDQARLVKGLGRSGTGTKKRLWYIFGQSVHDKTRDRTTTHEPLKKQRPTKKLKIKNRRSKDGAAHRTPPTRRGRTRVQCDMG
jgi:hypothetical protein